jgi:glutaredoxin 3
MNGGNGDNVTVYTIDACPYCDRAKSLLTQRGIGYKEIFIDRSNDEEVTAVRQRSGMRTFPQIYHGDRLIGGFSDLEAQDKVDALRSLVAK